MKQQPTVIMAILSSILLLSACHKQQPAPQQEQTASNTQASNLDVLPYLAIQTQRAEYALPFCEKKNCIDIDIQTLKTADPWLNTWLTTNLSKVVQAQIDLKQNLYLLIMPKVNVLLQPLGFYCVKPKPHLSLLFLLIGLLVFQKFYSY